MLATRIIPCLDVRDGRVVKGVNFRGLRDSGDPAELAAAYEQQGADELVMLDVSATLESRRAALSTIRAIRRCVSIPLTVGGGVKTIDDVGRLLDAGADKVSVNTAAVQEPELISEIAGRFGSQCAVLAIDAAVENPQDGTTNGQYGAVSFPVFTHSGSVKTIRTAPEWAMEAQRRGAGEILLTSISRDGTLLGFDLPLLRAVARTVTLPVIASGGAGTVDDFVRAIREGRADAVLAASVLHDGRLTIHDIKSAMRQAGITVRDHKPTTPSEATRP